jgi:GH24 family phage-related lysozyme (muramidase)
MKFEGREDLIQKVQKVLGVDVDGIDGKGTWTAIAKALNVVTTPQPTPAVAVTGAGVSDKAFKLILDYEVGGGEGYYNKALKRPCYPGGASGVTIGVGYDLGYNTLDQFISDWKDLITADQFDRLKAHLGKTSSTAKSAISSVKDIEIPWTAALNVFKKSTLPRFIKETLRAFPGADKLHPDAFGALVSLVFNRGASVTGNSRIEMFNIRNLISSKDYSAIAKQIRDMKRLWVGKGLDGLLKRRDEEASLVESCK